MLNLAEHAQLLSMKNVLIVGIFIFMTKWNFMLSWVEHEKSLMTSGPDAKFCARFRGIQGSRYRSPLSPFAQKNKIWHKKS